MRRVLEPSIRPESDWTKNGIDTSPLDPATAVKLNGILLKCPYLAAQLLNPSHALNHTWIQIQKKPSKAAEMKSS
jgi:hypothetical protein